MSFLRYEEDGSKSAEWEQLDQFMPYMPRARMEAAQMEEVMEAALANLPGRVLVFRKSATCYLLQLPNELVFRVQMGWAKGRETRERYAELIVFSSLFNHPIYHAHAKAPRGAEPKDLQHQFALLFRKVLLDDEKALWNLAEVPPPPKRFEWLERLIGWGWKGEGYPTPQERRRLMLEHELGESWKEMFRISWSERINQGDRDGADLLVQAVRAWDRPEDLTPFDWQMVCQAFGVNTD